MVTAGGAREFQAGREGGWQFVHGHSWKGRSLYIVWKKREDLKRVFYYVQKHPSELYSGVLFEQVMCLCLGPST